MQIAKLKMENFRGIKSAELEFDGHTILIGLNNVGKSTICEALELALGADRQSRNPVVEEFDFYNAGYLDEKEEPKPILIEVLLTNVTPTVERACFDHLERWSLSQRKILGEGEIGQVDGADMVWCLRLLTVARYNKEEDEFEASTHYAKTYDPNEEQESRVPRNIRRSFGFLYLRALRTGTRALSLERGSLLDVILRMQSLQTGIWEKLRKRLDTLTPPIEEGTAALGPILKAIEKRLAEYIPMTKPGEATRLFVSQLTREHLRKTVSFFLTINEDQRPVPFQEVGAGTLNTLVLALLTFIAELKTENVIFAIEEPEIALPPHTQRRIAKYLLEKTTQCFVTTHSPYVLECFEPERITILRRSIDGVVNGKRVTLQSGVKGKTYKSYIRRGFAEAMLGRGVIVVEGLTEQVALQSVAGAMEAYQPEYFPLDLSGVSIVCADGDGKMAEFGRFFVSLEMPTFGFMDKKKRQPKDIESLSNAGFQLLKETNFAGMETLLANEIPLGKQWEYLEYLRENELAPTAGLPKAQPSDDQIREYTIKILKEGKGLGRAAELIDRCENDELPSTLVEFLKTIYEHFPRPKPEENDEDKEEGDVKQPTLPIEPDEIPDLEIQE